MYTLTKADFSKSELGNFESYLDYDIATLEAEIAKLEVRCTGVVVDYYTQESSDKLSDGTWELLKKAYVSWKLWARTERLDLRDEFEDEFNGTLGDLIETKNRNQDKSGETDNTKTRGLLYVSEDD